MRDQPLVCRIQDDIYIVTRSVLKEYQVQSPMTEARRPKPEDRRPKHEDRSSKSEDQSPKTEAQNPKTKIPINLVF